MAVLSHGCDPGQTPIVESCFIPPFSLVSGVPFVSLPNRPFLLEYVAMHPVAALQHQTMSLALHCPDPAARWPAMCSVLSSLGSVARCFNLLTLWVSGPPPPPHASPLSHIASPYHSEFGWTCGLPLSSRQSSPFTSHKHHKQSDFCPSCQQRRNAASSGPWGYPKLVIGSCFGNSVEGLKEGGTAGTRTGVGGLE